MFSLSMFPAIVLMMPLVTQQVSAPAPVPGSRPAAVTTPPSGRTPVPGRPIQFAGSIRPKSSAAEAIDAVVFRVNPSEKYPNGIQIRLPVNSADGSFESTDPLPKEEISSIDTSPICLDVQTLDLRNAGGEVLHIVENGEMTKQASQTVGMSVSSKGFSIDAGARGAIATPLGLLTEAHFGGINVGCVNALGAKNKEAK